MDAILKITNSENSIDNLTNHEIKLDNIKIFEFYDENKIKKTTNIIVSNADDFCTNDFKNIVNEKLSGTLYNSINYDVLINKFQNGNERFAKDARFNTIIRSLANVNSPLQLLDEVLLENEKLKNQLIELYSYK